MCGIAGMIDWRAATSEDALRAIGEAMNESLLHRGPDGGAVWTDAAGGAMLAQRRLAIIDLSPGGAQPMLSADRRFVITFNGEIYNYREIRSELAAAGRALRSDSDTEVLLEACALWGVAAAVERTIGMFAFGAMGPHDADAVAGARPARHQADVLRGAAGPPAVRLAAQGVPRRAGLAADASIDDAVAGYLRHNYIAAATNDLSRGREAAARAYPDGALQARRLN